MEMRSTLGRVRGLGSSGEGVGHWWAQRVTAIALVPLCLWFVVSVIGLMGADHAAFLAWIGQFGNALLVVLLVLVMFHHAQLGLQVVIEDYVHGEAAKVATLMLVRFAVVAMGASCVLAVVLLGMGR